MELYILINSFALLIKLRKNLDKIYNFEKLFSIN